MLSAEVLWEKLKARHTALQRALDEDETLTAEYHTPSGDLLLLRDIGYFSDTDYLLFLVCDDPRTGAECQIITVPEAVQIVFRVVKRTAGTETKTPPKIGFHKDHLPKEETG